MVYDVKEAKMQSFKEMDYKAAKPLEPKVPK